MYEDVQVQLNEPTLVLVSFEVTAEACRETYFWLHNLDFYQLSRLQSQCGHNGEDKKNLPESAQTLGISLTELLMP